MASLDHLNIPVTYTAEEALCSATQRTQKDNGNATEVGGSGLAGERGPRLGFCEGGPVSVLSTASREPLSSGVLESPRRRYNS